MTDALSDGLTAGQWLRQARERHGMHIAILAAHIKVPTKKIEALESDDLSVFASPVFARSLALSICRVLKVDADPVLALLPPPPSPALRSPAHAHHEAPVRLRASRPATTGPSRTTVLVALCLVAVALGVAFAPDFSSRGTSTVSASNPGTVSEPVSPAVPMAQQVQVSEVAATSATTSATTAPTALVAAAPAASPSISTPTTATPTTSTPTTSTPATPTTTASTTPTKATAAPASAPSSPQAAPKAAPASDVLGLRTKGDSWIQVLDAQGQMLLSRVVLKGEQLSLGGALPMSVVIGRVDMTEVSVRGQPFSMAEIAQGNVARFEVK